jgi:hypothetical protein
MTDSQTNEPTRQGQQGEVGCKGFLKAFGGNGFHGLAEARANRLNLKPFFMRPRGPEKEKGDPFGGIALVQNNRIKSAGAGFS